MKNLNKTLHFNEKEINLVFADGQWWVAVKPVCEALGVDFEEQWERISRSKFLGQLPTKRWVVAADGKTSEMFCLPEKYIYGWLASINSDSKELMEYQKECLRFNFHGSFSALVERLQIERKMDNDLLRGQIRLDLG